MANQALAYVGPQSAFRGAPNYDPKAALAIPNEAMEALNVDHIGLVTPAQRTLYAAFAKTGQKLSWGTMAEIEMKALIKGGMKAPKAAATVNKAIKALKKAGVKAPTRIPWGGT